jgi:lipopolysaccharide transport system ATP-binding protein
MSNTVIKAENISKSYILKHQGTESYTALRDVITDGVKNAFRAKTKVSKDEFRALNDVSFEIKQGERVGVIGRNGAGKSTLLKVLSRIVTPTKGRITLDGRVASLLEVGTGFHPELSGRENIFLNGSILGMSKAEIKNKFDEIVAFSEVERFLDTPVKRYSSGMYVRLAFAVAAHLDPEILIVDEVLAVGDAEFQKKCLGKMKDVSGQGRTVLFVSHNMGAISSLCDKAIVLNKGSVVYDGAVSGGVSYYLQSGNAQTAELAERTDRAGNGNFRFTSLDFVNRKGDHVDEVLSGEGLQLKIGYENKPGVDLSKMLISVAFMDELQNIVLAFVSDEMGSDLSFMKNNGTFTLDIPEFLLRGGQYGVRLFACYNGSLAENICDNIENAARLNVISSDFWNSGQTIRQGNYSVIKGTYIQ